MTRHRQRALVLVMLVIAATLVPLLANAGSEPKAGQATIRFAPQEGAIAVGESITLDIIIEDVENLYALDFQFTFDPAKVTAPGGTIALSREVFPSGSFAIRNEVDNTTGEGWLGISKMNPDVAFTGSGKIGELTLQGVGNGYVAIEFGDVMPTNRDAEIMDVSTINAVLAIGAAGPTPTASPTPRPIGGGDSYAILLPLVRE